MAARREWWQAELTFVSVALLVVAAAAWGGWRWWKTPEPKGVEIQPFTIPIGKVREPLPYRIVSFHRGRADKNLIKLASQLGFNGVQFQIEGSNIDGLTDFADRDSREHLVDYCHSLGMKVTVWVHELSDLPGPWLPEYLGEVSVDNKKIWTALDARYQWILSKLVPNVDGLVLTVVETQTRATSTPIMLKLAELVKRQCDAHHKALIVRTFVWHPEEFAQVMSAVDKLPKDLLIMSKAVPQDWQMRGADAAELGAVGGRPQIEEFDAAGEYFLKDSVANCMVDLLKRQFDYGMSKKIQGICVRVDRDDYNLLFQPQEVNLWALGMLAAGAADSSEEIWKAWATYRYGESAVPGVIKALKPTADVVAEMLSIGPFTYGDTRQFPGLPDEDLLAKNWQNWRWSNAYVEPRRKADSGDAEFISQVAQQKNDAMAKARESLADIENLKGRLPEKEYQILHTRLLSNRVQLEFRTPMTMAALHLRTMLNAKTDAQWNTAHGLFEQDLARVKEVADAVSQYPQPEWIDNLDRSWPVNAPLGVTREQLYKWVYDAERRLAYYR